MALLINRIKSLFGRGDVHLPAAPPADPLDYEQLVTLDAESLAEQGILSAYTELSAQLERYSPLPLEVREVIDDDGLGYSVYGGDQKYVVWEVIDGVQNQDGWERATVAFFQIVKCQVEKFFSPLLRAQRWQRSLWPVSHRRGIRRRQAGYPEALQLALDAG